ncbi:unnamed protein product [Paramecium octaurelia]|uniref:Uncharacterized protein n=1 Tax=Paramecium octaurelia TaxID=43137 RepID=A0A8S1SAB1_PAROT|nr:unnamed protein product [Paramecium octaurelia]
MKVKNKPIYITRLMMMLIYQTKSGRVEVWIETLYRIYHEQDYDLVVMRKCRKEKAQEKEENQSQIPEENAVLMLQQSDAQVMDRTDKRVKETEQEFKQFVQEMANQEESRQLERQGGPQDK